MQDFCNNVAFCKGISCMDSKRYVEAIWHFNKASYLFPNEAEIYMHRGEAFLKCLDSNSAISNFKKAIQLVEEKVNISCYLVKGNVVSLFLP